MTDSRLLLCTDLDRTLIPNGDQDESPSARTYFERLVSHEQVTLVYVTGRHKELVAEAIDRYKLPVPDLVISDVGTVIYDTKSQDWTSWSSWEKEIRPLWAGFTHADLEKLFHDIDELILQEPEKQNAYKLSYYLPLHTDIDQLVLEMEERLSRNGVLASLIYSVDELADTGLLDVLPRNATKLHGLQFVRERLGFTLSETVFSGDSGNDISVLASEVQGTLVANASHAVRQQATFEARKNNNADTLYIASGGFLDMNGNYSAGILEGVVHYCPYTQPWIEE
jgi:sucrose-6F-phosphate phosphohydrolase